MWQRWLRRAPAPPAAREVLVGASPGALEMFFRQPVLRQKHLKPQQQLLAVIFLPPPAPPAQRFRVTGVERSPCRFSERSWRQELPTLGADVFSSSWEQTAGTGRGLETTCCHCTNIFSNENKQRHGRNMLPPATALPRRRRAPGRAEELRNTQQVQLTRSCSFPGATQRAQPRRPASRRGGGRNRSRRWSLRGQESHSTSLPAPQPIPWGPAFLGGSALALSVLARAGPHTAALGCWGSGVSCSAADRAAQSS